MLFSFIKSLQHCLLLQPIMQWTIRQGTPEDVPAILGLIRQLAEYEKAPDEVTVTEAQLLEDGFGAQSVYQVRVAEVDGIVVAMALTYVAYSTWKGKMLFLEDLIVQESHRRLGIGKALLDACIDNAERMGASLLKWQVLDWNQPAIDFYKNYPVQFDHEWVNVRLMRKDFSKQK